jgi:hypothetical protein
MPKLSTNLVTFIGIPVCIIFMTGCEVLRVPYDKSVENFRRRSYQCGCGIIAVIAAVVVAWILK